MQFDYSEEQQLVADSVRRFVAQEYGFETRRRILASDTGWSGAIWRQLAEVGLLGLPFPTEHGGFGGRAVDLMSVMEAIGAALMVEPYLATLVAGRLVARCGSDEQKSAIIPAIVEGRLRLAFAHGEAGARYDAARVATRARRSVDGFVIDGEKAVVRHAPSCERLVVSARIAGEPNHRQGIALFLVDAAAPGVSMKSYRTLDGVRAGDVKLASVTVGADALLGEPGNALPAIEEALDYGTALVCAEAVGALQSANDATLEYLKARKQFGVPIGSFQALQHRMVDMVISLEQARSMASLACARVDTETDSRERQRIVSAAKIKISDACRHVSQESVQLHGGMGMSDELKVSHTFRRLTMLAREFGDVDEHLARFARCSCSSPSGEGRREGNP